jgi:hypothetical protein
MASELIRIVTEEGPVTLRKNVITAIDPCEGGTKIQVETEDTVEKPQTYISTESYDTVVLLYLSA